MCHHSCCYLITDSENTSTHEQLATQAKELFRSTWEQSISYLTASCLTCIEHGVQGKAYDGKTDVWAIGCVLYEMCALKKAFDASNLGAITVKVMR